MYYDKIIYVDYEGYCDIIEYYENGSIKVHTHDKPKKELIVKEQKELSKKIEKVTLQLEIINQELRDPTVLERIEEYNNPFAPGNFTNLKKIAELIKKTEKISYK